VARQQKKVHIRQIPTGVPNLDLVLGGGIPAYSINVVAGPPGAGKTTLVQQILFHNATMEQKALYISALTEPLVKVLRYQQQFDFFDPDKINSSIVLHDIGLVARQQGLQGVLATISELMASVSPAFLVLDSFKALEELARRDDSYGIRAFVHDLGTILAAWETTSFLVGEYSYEEIRVLPEFSVADGIIWMDQDVRQNSALRKLQAVKMRGQAPMPGLHTFRISEEGILLFARALPLPQREEAELQRGRAAFGIPGLDGMMRGGIPVGETCLVAGSSGTGKTLLSLHFIVEGARVGEPGVMVTFEEHPREHERKARGFGWDLRAMEGKGLLKMIYLRPTDLSVDEVLYRVHEATLELKAKRVVINSISGFEASIVPSERQDFREALYRMQATLSAHGVTTVLTNEMPDIVGGFRLSTEGFSILVDNAIVLRYAEIESELKKALMVVKMRTSDHDKELRQYQITDRGVTVEEPFTQYSGILSGIPTLRAVMEPQPFTTGLSEQEDALMHVLLALRDSTLEQLAKGMGEKPEEVQKMLDKLVETGYVFQSTKGNRTVYRVGLISPVVSPKGRK